MIQELLYTSAPKGLKPGSRGFCTVLSTQGMSAPLAAALEGLSGYRPLFAPTDPRHADNPVVHSHLTFTVGGRRVNVLSRVADYGLDYTQRTNKLAHHVVVDPENQPAGGPAWLLGRSDFMRTTWEGEPRVIPVRQSAPSGDAAAGVCTHWQQATGDAGWAGVLAEAFLADPKRMAFLICPVGLDPLPLIAEAIALLPRERRWDVTFSTYFTSVPQNANCVWRCLVEATPEVHQSRRYVQALRLDLTRPLGAATGRALVDAARTGKMPTSATVRSEMGAGRDVPPPLVGVDPLMPAGDSAYRLQRVREFDHPPLLGVETERRPRRPGMPVVAILLAFLLVSAGIGIGAWVLKSNSTNATVEEVAAETDQEHDLAPMSDPGTVAEVSDMPSPATPERADSGVDSPSVTRGSDNVTEQLPADTESTPSTTDASGHTDDSRPNSDSNAIAGTTADTDTHATTKEASTTDREPQWTHIQLPSWIASNTETSDIFDISLPPVPTAEITLRLFAPSNYNGLLRADESSTSQELMLTYFDIEPAAPAVRIARFTVQNSSEGHSPKVQFEWVGYPVRREELRWCVLAVGSNDSVCNQFVLHSLAIGEQSIRELNKPIPLPQIALETTKERKNRSPQFQCDPFVLKVDGRDTKFELAARRNDNSPLDFRFLASSLQAMGIELKTIKLGSSD